MLEPGRTDLGETPVVQAEHILGDNWMAVIIGDPVEVGVPDIAGSGRHRVGIDIRA